MSADTSDDGQKANKNKQGSGSSERASEYLNEFYERLEKFAKSTNDSFKSEILPEIEKKAKENPFMSMLLSFMAGALLCLFIGRRKSS
ncbi:MAG: hypothetical protein AB8G05_27865 [Oligoflexales bacterium]